LTFVETLLVPFLYGFSFRERHGSLPFGDLEHGKKRLLDDFSELYGVRDAAAVKEMVLLTMQKRRQANKHLCPCGSGKRVGRCHNQKLNEFRAQLGRNWFRHQHGLSTREEWKEGY
jgi:hypothetical protein